MISNYKNIHPRVSVLQKHTGSQNELNIADTGDLFDYLFCRNRGGIYQEILNSREINIGRIECKTSGAFFDKPGFGKNMKFLASFIWPFLGAFGGFRCRKGDARIKDK